MKVAIIISTFLAVATAKPSVLLYTAPQTAIYAAAGPLLRQYHSQSELGQYTYGYDGGPSAKSETRSIDGVTRGSYSYVDPDNKLQSVEYTADAAHGFRVTATNLPVAPIDDRKAPEQIMETPEVMEARAEHLRMFEESKNRAELEPAALKQILFSEAPKQIEETPEVMAARAEHLRMFEESKVRAALEPAVFDEILISEAPKQIEETPEVMEARAEHLRMFEESKMRAEMEPAALKKMLMSEAPKQIEDTPEVMAARAEHFRMYEEMKMRAEAPPKPISKVFISQTSPTFYSAPAHYQTIAAPFAPAPVLAYKAPEAYAAAPIIAYKSPETAYSYSFSSPAYAYSIGAPAPVFAHPHSYTYGAPLVDARQAGPAVFYSAPQELPQQVKDTEEVSKARAEHLAIVAEAKVQH